MIPGDDARLFVVLGCVAGQLQHLSREILEDGREIDSSPCSRVDKHRILKKRACEARSESRSLDNLDLRGQGRLTKNFEPEYLASAKAWTRRKKDGGGEREGGARCEEVGVR